MDNLEKIETKETWDLLADNAKQQTRAVFDELIRTFDKKSRITCNYISHPHPDELASLSPISEALNIRIDDNNDNNENLKKKKKIKPKKSEIYKLKNILNESQKYLNYIKEYPFGFAQSTNIVELILFCYVNRAIYTKKKRKSLWLESIISIRDGLHAFDSIINIYWKKAIKEFIQEEFSSKCVYELLKNTHLLLKSDFKLNHDTAIKLYPEQKELLNKLDKNNGRGIYKLPWGVGCGKTEMVPAIAYIATKYKHCVIYSVSTGPIRDQMASLLLKCGVPFSFVIYSSKIQKYEVQPSFACKNGVIPEILISNFDFAYLCISSQTLPVMKYPEKSSYKHINDGSFWEKPFWLIIDEPDIENKAVLNTLKNPPETMFVMSATSAHIIDDNIVNNYIKKYPDNKDCFCEIKGGTIGVSASLFASWVDPPQLISPWHGCVTKQQFEEMTNKIEMMPILKRYVSPMLVYKWIKEFNMPFALDIDDISYTSISDIGIAIAKKFIIDFDDDWFGARFALPSPDKSNFNFSTVIDNTNTFWGGTLIGIKDMEKSLNELQNYLTLPDISDLEKKLNVQTELIRTKIKQTDKLKKDNDDKPIVIPTIDTVPIDNELIINSFEWAKRRNYELSEYTLPQIPVSTGSMDDPDGWKIELDLTTGVSELKEQLRLVGVCNIDENNLLTKKNIREMNSRKSCITISDELGAFGLNMPMQNVILYENQRAEIIRQLAGRVGRASQKDAGKIFIKSPEILSALLGFN